MCRRCVTLHAAEQLRAAESCHGQWPLPCVPRVGQRRACKRARGPSPLPACTLNSCTQALYTPRWPQLACMTCLKPKAEKAARDRAHAGVPTLAQRDRRAEAQKMRETKATPTEERSVQKTKCQQTDTCCVKRLQGDQGDGGCRTHQGGSQACQGSAAAGRVARAYRCHGHGHASARAHNLGVREATCDSPPMPALPNCPRSSDGPTGDDLQGVERLQRQRAGPGQVTH